MSQTSGTDKPTPPPAPRGHPLRGAVLYLFLVAGGVLAAWQVHDYLVLRSQRPPSAARPDVPAVPALVAPVGPGAGRPAASRATSRAAGLLGDPLQAAGFTRLTGNPGQIPPPPGAQPGVALEQAQEGQITQQATYLYKGTQAQAVEHYQQTLAAKGFRLLGDTTSPARRVLVFENPPLRVILSLRNRSPNANIDSVVNISLTVIRPAP